MTGNETTFLWLIRCLHFLIFFHKRSIRQPYTDNSAVRMHTLLIFHHNLLAPVYFRYFYCDCPMKETNVTIPIQCNILSWLKKMNLRFKEMKDKLTYFLPCISFSSFITVWSFAFLFFWCWIAFAATTTALLLLLLPLSDLWMVLDSSFLKGINKYKFIFSHLFFLLLIRFTLLVWLGQFLKGVHFIF